MSEQEFTVADINDVHCRHCGVILEEHVVFDGRLECPGQSGRTFTHPLDNSADPEREPEGDDART